MRGRGKLVMASSVLLGVLGCSLAYDLDGFTSTDDVGTDATTSDAPNLADVSTDGGNGGDSSVDTGAGGRCPSGRGPIMIEADSFCIDSTEVTQAQYAEFLTSIANNPPAKAPECAQKTSFALACPEYNPSTQASFPVGCVDWCAAWSFCAWAGKRLCGAIGGGQRITPDASASPQISEWMSACTHKGERSFPYGAQGDSTACPTGAGPHAVTTAGKCQGGYQGLFDMNANLEEWENACVMQGGALNCLQRGGDSYANGVHSCATNGLDLITDTRRDNGIRCCADKK